MARYQVIRGVVHHPGGIAAPGEIIALDPAEGDPLCVGRAAVLAPVTAVGAGLKPAVRAGLKPAPTPAPPKPAPTPTRRRRAAVGAGLKPAPTP